MTQQMPSRVPTKAAVAAKKRSKISVAAAPAKKIGKGSVDRLTLSELGTENVFFKQFCGPGSGDYGTFSYLAVKQAKLKNSKHKS
jgi:hypothetical protein